MSNRGLRYIKWGFMVYQIEVYGMLLSKWLGYIKYLGLIIMWTKSIQNFYHQATGYWFKDVIERGSLGFGVKAVLE